MSKSIALDTHACVKHFTEGGFTEKQAETLAKALFNAMTGPMSTTTVLDTHACVKRLTEGGFTKEQAEAVTEGYVDLFNANLAMETDIAEKAGKDALRKETKADVTEIRAGTDAE